ncbi:MAG: transcriptional regulator NrdR [Proteobacteria bacterium]|nr:transcriptional regulator NrdR [Pseudomonadota bacterium]
MRCPFCKNTETQVIDSRVSDEGESIRRRRRCTECNNRFTTYENIVLRMPQIIKSNGPREEFKDEKLRTGFMRALHRRPVSANLVDESINRVKNRLLASGDREVNSRRIGELVMKELHRLDNVAYIRFASVYRDFQDADDFQDAIKEVQKIPGSKQRMTD